MSDQTTPAGAMPVAGGATPPQTTPVSPAAQPPTAAPTPPATGDPDALGEAGKRAIEAERKAARDANKRAEAAEREVEELRNASRTDQEKAIAAARREGAKEAQGLADAKVRRAEVRRALTEAGCQDIAIAALAAEFAELKVDEAGDVEGLAKAIEAFKSAHPALFGKPLVGSADAGVRGTGAGTAPDMNTLLRAAARGH